MDRETVRVLHQQLPHDGLQNAAVFVVVELDGRVDAERGLEGFGFADWRCSADGDFGAGF